MTAFVPLEFTRRPDAEITARATALRDELAQRRSVRHFSSDPVPREAIAACIEAAAQAPSGANKQPWTFVLIEDPALKRRIRAGAEEEERRFYEGGASEQWLEDLEPLGTDADKRFLEEAPALIVLFAQRTGPDSERHYYVQESVGIAAGFLIAALHHAGFATLTHTPSPMRFLGEILERPDNERPYLLLPVGFPADGCEVPDLLRKPRSEVLVER
jgi:nitroreductase